MALKRVEKNKEVAIYCFEPSKKAFAGLRQALRHDARCCLNNVALSSRDGAAELYDVDAAGGSQAASLEVSYSALRREAKECFTESVRVRTGDSVLGELEIKNIDLLKIDVEGHELEVIEGFRESLKKEIIGAIQFEFNEGLKRKGIGLSDFRMKLPQYLLFRLLPSGRLLPLHEEDEDIYSYQNIVGLPLERK